MSLSLQSVRRLGGVALLSVVLCACAEAGGAGPAVTREVVGDTTIVRVSGDSAYTSVAEEELRIGELEGPEEYTFGRIDGLAVSGDGTMYVLDQQARNVRVFDASGRYVRTFGRSGEGPGEFKQPGGMGFLPDGRLVVRDQGNARMNIFTPQGELLTTWPLTAGFFTSQPIFIDRRGNVYTDVIADRDEKLGMFRTGLLRLDSTGAVVDMLRRPFHDYQPPRLRAESGNAENRSVSINSVPFWPQAITSLNRDGEFVGGIADRYAVHTWRADGKVQRIERELPPVRVDPGHAETEVERVTRSMRSLDPNWKWDGPRPPDTKPAFSDVRIAEDGRMWVRVPRPSEKQPPDPDAKPDEAGRRPLDVWLEPMVYDVYEENGDFVATVRFPARFRPMVLRGEHAWGVIRDELDVQYIVRLRVLPATAAASPEERSR